MIDTLLVELNSEQIKPVLHTEGAVLVLAGAGSGKTRVLISRIAYILSKGLADLSSILAITFTNKAADEMKERLLSVTGQSAGKWICTIHSMCVKILRQFAERADLRSDFSIYSETERTNILKRVIAELDYDDEKLLKTAKFHIANAKTKGYDPDQYGRLNKDEHNIDKIVIIYDKYERHLQENNALDFDDLLLQTLRLLRRDKDTLDYLSDKFKYILVDEFQDTNAVQYDIIKLLASKHGNIFAVGDDDQSIYGWRGAEIKNIMRFDRDFANATMYKLERNYRSTKSILSLANSIIKNNTSRHGKTLWTEAEDGESPTYFEANEEAGEALFAARIIKEGVARGKKFSDYAVLMRINALTRSYEQEFANCGIPFKVFGGFRFYERKEIKDVLAYLRLVANRFDSEAAERIINVPKRGIGGRTIEVMYEYAQGNFLSLFDAAQYCDELSVTKSAKDKLKEFYSLIKELIISSQITPVNQLVREIIEKTDIRSAYDDRTDEGDAKLANIDQFIASVDDFSRLNPNATLSDYLQQISLSSDTDEINDGNYVTIATIHSVKGLEYPTVFICGLEEGIMPTSRAEQEGGVEEERRLMYVAITRAEKQLYLTRSRSRYLYGKKDLTTPSRFVKELSKELKIPVIQTYSPYGGGARYGYKNEYRSGERNFGKALYSDADGYESDFAPISTFKPAFGTPVTKSKAAEGSCKYTVGMRVRHPKFGIGMVIAVKNGNTVNIAFDGQGIKELSAQLAPLEIL
ncbi:MAG: UvrD-helicase domain-containing protein [Clostridia bacterium]|nr:UvrD-helicase domain-containing protein [Clostridia bacterium]